MDGVPVLPQLPPLQLARVSFRGPDQLRAPLEIADVVLDVPLGDLRVRRAPASPQGPVIVALSRKVRYALIPSSSTKDSSGTSERGAAGHIDVRAVMDNPQAEKAAKSRLTTRAVGIAPPSETHQRWFDK